MTSPGGRNANVTVTADVSGYTKAIGTANAATLQFANALKKIDDGVLSITKKIGVGAMAAGGAGLLAAFGDVKQAAQLQQSFAALGAQATQTGTKVGEITTGVQKMSTQIPVATASLAQMATQIAALGVTGSKNILTLTKQAEQLAAATNTAPGQLFSQLLQMNQSLGGSIQNLERYGSALTTLQNKMGTSATDVMQMANSIQAVGQKAGMSEQNILGVAAAMVKVGADGTAGATAFNQIMSAMTDSVSRNSTSMLQFTQIMGLTTDQFKQMVSNDPTQAISRFIGAIQSEGPRASITLQALGLDSTRLTRVFAALSSGQANLQGALAQSNQAFNENTATATAAAAAWDTLDSTFTKLHSSVSQIKDLLGGPLLGPINAIVAGFTHLTDAVSSFIHFADDAPWPIGDTLTSLVTKTPALLLLGGAFITLTASLSKFLGVYRMLSGAVGINAFRGLTDGLRGNAPRAIDGQTGRLGSMLYRTTYGMGRGNNDYGVNARQGLGSMVAGYPVMRARQQMGSAWDTLKHPFNPDARDASKTDPLSTYGMWQSASRGGKNVRENIVRRLRMGDGGADSTPGMRSHIADRMEAGFGSFDESAEGMKRRRFDYVENARHEATVAQQRINRTLGRTDLEDMVQSGEAGRYYEKNGTLDGYTPTPFKKLSYKQLHKLGDKQAGWVGDQVATQAGKEFDASLTDSETAKLANPFQKLATKITEITKTLVNSTGDAIKAIFAKITEWYGQAVTQIKELANQAKISMVEVQAYAQNPAAAHLNSPAHQGLVDAQGRPLVSTVTQEAKKAEESVSPGAVWGGGPAKRGMAGWAEEAAGKGALAASSVAGRAQTGLLSLLGGSQPNPREEARVQAEETVKAQRALRPTSELVGEGVIGFPGGTQFAGIGPRRGPLAMLQDQQHGDLVNGVGPGFERGGNAGNTLRPGRLANAYANNRLIGPEGFIRQTALPAAGRAAGAVGSAAMEAGSALGTFAKGIMNPQLMIAATLLGPALYSLLQKVQAARSLAASTGDYAGRSTAQTLGQQVLTPQQIAQNFTQKTADSNTADFFNDTAFANSKSGSFLSNNSSVINQLKAIGNSKLSPQQKLAQERLILQREAAGDVMSNGGTPLTAAEQGTLAQQAMAFTGDPKSAAEILGGPTETAIDPKGQGVGGFYTGMAGSIRATSGDDKTALVKAFGAQGVDDYTTGKGSGLVGVLAGAGAIQQQDGTNVYSQGRADKADTGFGKGGPNEGGAPSAKPGDARGFGGGDTEKAIQSFVDSWNSQDENKKDGRKLDASGITSVQGFAQYLQHTATAKTPDGKNIEGHDAAVEMLNNLKLAGVNINDLAVKGSISAQALSALADKANNAANALQSNGAKTDAQGHPYELQSAFQAATGDTTGKTSILDLLNTPDAANYTSDIDKTMSALYKNYGGNDSQSLDPANAQAFRKEAEAIEQLKETVQNGGQQWQQLDQLEQSLYGKSATASVGIGGGIKEQVQGLTTNLSDLLDTQSKNMANPDVLNALAPEIDTQKASLEQSTTQLFNQLNQYRIQVRDFHIQQQREQQDHTTQMSRMQRDYNRQTGEADYSFQKQQDESAYQYKKSQDEQLYSFNEQLRLQKYAISKTWGSPTSMVQAQFTQGAGSALLGLNKQTADLQKSNDAMNGLAKVGVSTDVIRTLGLDDPKNFEQAQRYLKDFISNPALVKSFNDSVAQNLNISSAIAANPNNSQFAEMQKQFDHTAQLAAESFAHSADLAMQAFAHSMQQSKISYDTQMQDFQADYNKATARSLEDLSRLGEDTQTTWQNLVDWAKNSGIPGISALGNAGQSALGLIQAAAAAVSGSLQALPGQMNTAITQISSSLQSYLNSNPALKNAFEIANGIDPGTGGGNGGAATDKNSNIQAVKGRAAIYGWDKGGEWDALNALIMSESGYQNTVKNPTSSAYGMFQFIDGTWGTVGGAKTSDPVKQAQYGLAYIAQRYGDPINAWNFHKAHNSYANGAVFNGRQTIDVGEAGPEVVLPLNEHGAQFLARTTGAMLNKMGITPTDVRRNRVAQGMPMQAASNMSYHHTDASTHFNGAITVVAQDPNAMLKALQAKKRQQALTRPMAKR